MSTNLPLNTSSMSKGANDKEKQKKKDSLRKEIKGEKSRKE